MTTTEVTVKGYGSTEDEAYTNALRAADRRYSIASSVRIRKVRNEKAWNVVFAVYGRHDGQPVR